MQRKKGKFYNPANLSAWSLIQITKPQKYRIATTPEGVK